MTVLLASVSVWVLLLVGAAFIALVVLLSVEFGRQSRHIKNLRVERETERADFAAWHARHAGRLCEEVPGDADEQVG